MVTLTKKGAESGLTAGREGKTTTTGDGEHSALGAGVCGTVGEIQKTLRSKPPFHCVCKHLWLWRDNLWRRLATGTMRDGRCGPQGGRACGVARK